MRLWIQILCGLLLGIFAAVAQTGAGTVEGTVRDSTGAVIPGAEVKLVQTDTAVERTTTTTEAGLFAFPALQPGNYRIEVATSGMEKWEGKLVLQTGQRAAVDPVLKVAATATEVTVAGDVTPLVTTTSPTLATVVERERIEQLPLNGRFFQNLIVQTTPGVEGSSGAPRAEAEHRLLQHTQRSRLDVAEQQHGHSQSAEFAE